MKPLLQYYMRMNNNTFVYGQGNNNATEPFDLFRLSKSKQVVDVSSNTLRAYNRQGLPFHRQGKVVFVSRRELDEFIRRNHENAPSEKQGYEVGNN